MRRQYLSKPVDSLYYSNIFSGGSYLQCDFSDAASEIFSGSHAKLILGDWGFAVVPDGRTDMCGRSAVTDNNHLLAKQRSQYGLDSKFLSAVTDPANGENAGDLVAERKVFLAESNTAVEKGLA